MHEQVAIAADKTSKSIRQELLEANNAMTSANQNSAVSFQLMGIQYGSRYLIFDALFWLRKPSGECLNQPPPLSEQACLSAVKTLCRRIQQSEDQGERISQLRQEITLLAESVGASLSQV
jgi:hypothetical protein